MMKKRLAITVVLLLVITGIMFIALRPKPQRFSMTSDAMSTYVSISAVSRDQQVAESAIKAAFSSIRDLEKRLSWWTRTSEMAAISFNAGIRSVRVSPETYELARISVDISNNTSGAFDPTVGPLMRLWDLQQEVVPSKEQVSAMLEITGFRRIRLDPSEKSIALVKSGMSFDTGGIAKGYAVDRAVEILKVHGIDSGLVAIAGDMRAFGTREDGKPWKVGIRDPRGVSEKELIATLELRDEAISTSGDYERFFIKDGKRYHHILDPATGYPAEGTMSFSVLAPRAVLTDGYSTGAFVLGPEKGLEAIKKQGLEGVAISSDGRVFVSEGLKGRLKWVSDKYKLIN